MQERKSYNPMMIQRTQILEDENTGVIEGRFITFDSIAPYGNTGYYEMIDRHALDETLKSNRDICCFYNHDRNIILGRESNGTLQVELRDDGLYGVCKINLNDTDCKNAYERICRGDVNGCSFAGTFEEEELQQIDDKDVFVVKRANLFEISPCATPFYEDTIVSARQEKIDEHEAFKRRWEAFKDGHKLPGSRKGEAGTDSEK